MSWAFVVTFGTLLIWVPILAFFLRSWLRRKNPISLSICAIILLVIYTGVLQPYASRSDPDVFLLTMGAVNVVTASHFYVSWLWAKKRFRGDRRADEEGVDRAEEM